MKSYAMGCELSIANGTEYKLAYEECLNTVNECGSWYQQPSMIIGGLTVTLGIGVLLGMLLK